MNPLLRRLQTEEVAFFHPGFLANIFDEPNSRDVQAGEHPGFQRIRDMLKPQKSMLPGGIAVLPIHGPLARKPDPFEMLFYGVEDSGAAQRMVEEAAKDESILGVILDIDSPGGMVSGGVELSDAVAALDKVKPVYAYTSGMAASLGYHIASRARKIGASRGAQVGSIGTVISWIDVTERLKAMGLQPVTFVSAGADLKRAGSPGAEMTKGQSAYFQSRVDSAAAEFHSAVAEKRGALPAEVKRGGMFWAAQAKESGLIDFVAPLDFVAASLRREIRGGV